MGCGGGGVIKKIVIPKSNRPKAAWGLLFNPLWVWR